jgi:hypothetical protein
VALALPILNYAAEERPANVPLWARLLPVFISLPAIAVVFLPFAEGTSPWDVVLPAIRWPGGADRQLAFLGIPFFLAFVLFWIGVRRLIWSSISAAELVIAWVLIGGSIAATIVFNASALPDILHDGNEPRLLFFISLAILIVGELLVFLRRRRMPRGEVIVCALYVAYLANAGMCVPGFADHPNEGWYVTLPIAAVMIVWLACLLLSRRKPV